MRTQVTIGLPQFAASDSPAANADKAESLVRQAAAQGAQIVCLQELCTTRYFCQSEDPANFDLTERIPGRATDRFSALAKELAAVIILPLFEKRALGVYHNTAVVIDADGSLLGKYRKMHIPEDPGFHEKFYFSPGDLGYQAWETAFGTIGVLICWDQWFPEAARLTAMRGADILFYPTAIGWLPEDEHSIGPAQHQAWQTVQRGHAVANGCYVAVVNRIGREGDTLFWGRSFVANPYGEILTEASTTEEGVAIAQCDLNLMKEFRRIWPFFRDRRTDSFAGLQERWGS